MAAEAPEGTEVREGRIVVVSPATGQVVGEVPVADAADVAGLCAAAREAQPGWESAGFEGRGEVLAACERWIASNQDRVIGTISAETGKTADEVVLAELAYAVSALGFWRRMAPAYLADEDVDSHALSVRGKQLRVRYRPIGVVGVIGPWNFPLVNSFGDCIPALAAGNAVVLKPSEVTPLTSVLMAEMLRECGLPEGVFAVAPGGGEVGAALVDATDYVMFTGSAETGRKVMARAAETLTPVGLELGGKDPMIVLADADLERAANAAVTYGMQNSGQVCISVERVYVEDAVHDAFVGAVVERVGALRQGPPGDLGSVDVGAMIHPPQLEIVDAHVRDALDKGAEALTGGRRSEGPGRFYEPTVLVGVDHSMACMREETFGPTLPIMRVSGAEEAVELANDSEYGLQASVWTGDPARGEEVARRVEAGVVCVNDAQVNYAALELPMGGWKASGLGVRHGAAGIRKYTAQQSLLVEAMPKARDAHMLPYSAQVTAQIAQTIAFMATSDILDDAQRMTLTALCDTFVPSIEAEDDPHGLWARKASDLAVPEAIEQALSQQPPEQVEGIRELLDTLARQGFPQAPSQEVREQVVQAFMEAGPEARAGMSALRSLTLALHYGLPDLGTGRNPNWPAIGYPGPLALPAAPAEAPKTIRVEAPQEDVLELRADVAVVGSGCGGAVIAAELAAAGLDVCIVEMGSYLNEQDFNGLEMWAYQNLYLRGGTFLTADGQVSLLSGSCLGGGSVVNWTNCLRTTPWVREEWAAAGLDDVASEAFDGHLDAVWRRLGVNDRCSDLNVPQQLLRDACDRLGYDFQAITRNADPDRYQPELAGFQGFGDVTGSKQSTLRTYLQDAVDAGARVVCDTAVERIRVEQGRATGIEGTWTHPDPSDGRTARVRIEAAEVVVAAGALESPALLLRSGIGGPEVGKHLRLHPATAVIGEYGRPTEPWWGAMQAGLSHQFANAEEGHGLLIESTWSAPGLGSAALPWRSGREHKELVAETPTSAGFVFLIRDRGSGRVTIDDHGQAVHTYPFDDELDQRNFRRGLEEMVRLHVAAGARKITPLSRVVGAWREGEDVDRYIERLAGSSLAPYDHAIFALHQMGSCRMGSDPASSVARPDGRLHDTEGVWIGDASAFPTASGTNPMISVMALARRTAERIAEVARTGAAA